MIDRIISGGQTGVDRAALDVAIELNINWGGWCPQGRLDELGKIPDKYNCLQEISGQFQNEKENYDERTKSNIRDSDGTLILVPEIPIPVKIKDGTLLTISEVKKQGRPYLLIDLSQPQKNIEYILDWAKENNVHTLNIAGPRESNWPGIYELSFKLLENLLPELIDILSLKNINT